jgi:putative toxin-antitoxin system antitoxin component (TIGR02293 family)
MILDGNYAMITRAAIRRKSIQAQELLDAAENIRAQTQHPYTHMLLPPGQGHNMVLELSRGVTGEIAEQFRKKVNIDESTFSRIIGYSRMHYSRLAKNPDKHLRGAASNRLYRFAQILEHAIDLYNGDEETALKWLKTPNVAFDNATPLELLSSEVGSGMVDGLITQLELGILPA